VTRQTVYILLHKYVSYSMNTADKSYVYSIYLNVLQVAVVLDEYEKDRRQLQEVGAKLGAAVGSLDR
jgi:hypothetical protein